MQQQRFKKEKDLPQSMRQIASGPRRRKTLCPLRQQPRSEEREREIYCRDSR